MATHNLEVASPCLAVNSEHASHAEIHVSEPELHWDYSSDEADALDGLDGNELLAAYLVHEPHMEPILRLLLNMSDEQRRISLGMLECLKMMDKR